MDQNFFNRILHLIHARPKQGRRMIGLGAAALWELWQRINQLEQAVHLKRANAPERKRQSRGAAIINSKFHGATTLAPRGFNNS